MKKDAWLLALDIAMEEIRQRVKELFQNAEKKKEAIVNWATDMEELDFYRDMKDSILKEKD